MRPALVGGQRVYFIDDHAASAREHLAPGAAGEQQVERFGGCDQNPHGLWRIAGTHLGPNRRGLDPQRRKLRGNAGQGVLEIALNVVRQGLERGNVDHLRGLRQLPGSSLAHQLIDRREEGGQRLARAGRGRDQYIAAAGNRRPGRDLP